MHECENCGYECDCGGLDELNCNWCGDCDVLDFDDELNDDDGYYDEDLI